MTHMLAALLLHMASSATLPGSADAAYFPRPYYQDRARTSLQQTAMETWPGPSELVKLWREGELSEEERVTLLLGGAAFHDLQLLPLYEDAVRSDSGRLRMAGAYGYRDLLADLPPNVTGGVSAEDGHLLAHEMRAVARSLRHRPLIAMWLEVVLRSEGRTLPGYLGVSPERPPTVALEAVEELMQPEDLDLLVTAYELAGDREHRITLLQLIEGLTLSNFVIKPQGVRVGWSPETMYDDALRRLDAWIAQWHLRRCRIDFEEAVAANLAAMGARRVRPLDREACGVWLRVLKQGRPEWAGLAARRLYECGGPWVEMSVLQAGSPAEQRKRRDLLRWYRESR